MPISTMENQPKDSENDQSKKESEMEISGGETDELIGSPGQEQPPKAPDQSQQIPIGPLAAQLIMADILAQQVVIGRINKYLHFFVDKIGRWGTRPQFPFGTPFLRHHCPFTISAGRANCAATRLGPHLQRPRWGPIR